MRPMDRAWWGRVGAAISAALILWATLTPSTASSLVGGGFFCPFCGGAGLANLVRNVILFVPLGYCLVLAGLSVGRATLLAFALTAGVEFTQNFIPGRNPLLVDLLANGTGGWVGARLARGASAWLLPGPWRRRVLLSLACAAALGGAVAPALLLVPHDAGGDFWSQWNPRIGAGGVAYPGPVVEARLGARSLPPGALNADEAIRRAWRAGEPLVVGFEVSTEPVPPGTTGLYRLLSRFDGQPILSLTVEEGVDLRVVVGARAALWGMSGPRPVLPGLVGRYAPGEVVHLAFRLLPGGRLQVEEWPPPAPADRGATPDAAEGGGAPDPRVHLLPGSTPASGWSLLYVPPHLGEGGRRILGVLWCAGLLLLATFWARSLPVAVGAAAGVGLVLLLSPLWVPGLGPLPWEAGVGALLGAVGGTATGRWIEARAEPLRAWLPPPRARPHSGVRPDPGG